MLESAKVIEQIIGASGNDKLYILERNKDNETLKSILRFIYNPYNKCCIGAAKLNKHLNMLASTSVINPEPATPEEVIKYLSKNNTGTDLAVAYGAKFILQVEHNISYPAAVMLAVAIVKQDLKMGISTKSLNKVFGVDFIPVVGCMLGTLHSDVKNPKWPCIMTEKLDGIRRILIKENGVVRAFSRSGHEDTGCVDIISEAKYLPNNMVYDGELLPLAECANNIEQRQMASSIANSNGVKHGLSLNIFDALPLDEFYAGTSKWGAKARKELLAAWFGDEGLKHLRPDDYVQLTIGYKLDYNFKYLKAVPIIGIAKSIDEVTPYLEELFSQHKEGIMLNYVNGLYEIKRSKDLMKLKFTEEKTLTVIDYTEGTGKYEDSLGSLIVDYKGARVGVGSGLSDSLRDKIWRNPSKYMNKEIEIDTFGESVNQSGGISLNCPIFKRFKGEVE